MTININRRERERFRQGKGQIKIERKQRQIDMGERKQEVRESESGWERQIYKRERDEIAREKKERREREREEMNETKITVFVQFLVPQSHNQFLHQTWYNMSCSILSLIFQQIKHTLKVYGHILVFPCVLPFEYCNEFQIHLVLSIYYLISVHFFSLSEENVAFALLFVSLFTVKDERFSLGIRILLLVRLVVGRKHC